MHSRDERTQTGRSEPLFSVIIPTYNRASYIRETLESVFAQQETSYEVIVVDDGSTDNTREVLAEYSDRIQVIEQSNAGPGAARNRGAAAARGEYLAFLDSDDLWFPWTLATYRAVIDNDPSTSLLTSRPVEFSHKQELGSVKRDPLESTWFTDFYTSAMAFRFIGSGTMVIDCECFLRTRGFPAGLRVAEDLDLAMRLGVDAGFVYIERPPLLAYRRHDGNSVLHVDAVIDGVGHLIAQERAGCYPGGPKRQAERQTLLTRFARSASVDAIRNRRTGRGFKLYCRTFVWNAALGRVKYLAAFPVFAAARATWSRVNSIQSV